MTIDNFFKTLGYAFLYKGLGEKVNQIPLRELTVSLFRASAPKELLNQISKEGYIIEKQSPGIYYVNGLSVPTQLAIQVKKIASGRENIFPSTGYLLLLLKNSNIGQRRRYS